MIERVLFRWDRPPQPDFDGEPDKLSAFCRWWSLHAPPWPIAPPGALFNSLPWITDLALYRCGQFQVALVIVSPNVDLPEHSHPNVDSFEFHVAGDLRFCIDGEPAFPFDLMARHKRSRPILLGRGVRVAPNQLHSLRVGDSGGAFISVQHWIAPAVPGVVGLDWHGSFNDDHHARAASEAPRMGAGVSPDDRCAVVDAVPVGQS